MNRLAAETSPYLRQHADNPVDWYPWGDDAFAAARASSRPIFLSVGYSACHWCHVMAHESFEDPATAAVMNELFVNVKVDREERPDVDAVYMDAVQSITGRGGWPMSVWLLPDGRPFYGGTYFPPSDRQGMAGFVTVCRAVAEAFVERRPQIEEQAGQLAESIGRRLPVVESPITSELLPAPRAGLRERFDAAWGGFAPAPKFPPAQVLLFLGRQYTRDASPETLEMITTTLDAMAAGGMYDHLGGGFARYSVDAHWLVPHFEKMLYDNALLTRAYTQGWLLTGDERYRRVVGETIGYVQRDLGDPSGGYWSAEDADAEGVEGKFACWSIDEVRDVCGRDADAVIAHYGITDRGNFVDPHTGFRGNVLHAVDRHATPDEAVERGRAALFARREARVRPGLDDKILLAWNALMARALAEAGWVFDRTDWSDAARRNAEFLLDRFRGPDGRLLRSWQADTGEARHLAYCEDYAALVELLVTLAELDAIEWLVRAREVADAMIDLFADPDGGFFTTGRDAEALIVRPQDFMDNATPSENSMAAVALLRLAVLTGHDGYAEIARATVARFVPLVVRAPAAFGSALEAVERLVEEPIEIAIVGDLAGRRGLERTVAGRLIPSAVVVRGTPGTTGSPLLDGRGLVDGLPAAYVCEGYACRRPVTDVTSLETEIERTLSERR